MLELTRAGHSSPGAVFELDAAVTSALFAHAWKPPVHSKKCSMPVSGGRSRKYFYLFVVFPTFGHQS